MIEKQINGFGMYLTYDPYLNKNDLERMASDIDNLGFDGLSFMVSIDKDGWVARCQQIPRLTCGSDNPSPSKKDLENSMAEAILTAFYVRSSVPKKEKKVKKFSPEFTYSVSMAIA